MRRRTFIVGVGSAAAWPIAARAQQGTRAHRIGFLGNSSAALEANLVQPFRDGLRDLGYDEARNLVIEYRWADGNYQRFPALIDELVKANVEVIITAGTPAALAVARATAIPLVMVAVGDPVGTGLIATFAHPGGSSTGLTSLAPELEGKRLELLREIIPNLASVAVLWNPTNAYMVESEREVQSAAARLQIKVTSLAVRDAQELEQALTTVAAQRPGAMNVLADRLFLHNRARIVEVSAQSRLPGIHAYRELVEAGALMSYGPSYADMHRRAATYVDQILRGAKPADLPVQAPAKFEFVLNVKAAKSLGIVVPSALLARADEVIE